MIRREAGLVELPHGMHSRSICLDLVASNRRRHRGAKLDAGCQVAVGDGKDCVAVGITLYRPEPGIAASSAPLDALEIECDRLTVEKLDQDLVRRRCRTRIEVLKIYCDGPLAHYRYLGRLQRLDDTVRWREQRGQSPGSLQACAAAQAQQRNSKQENARHTTRMPECEIPLHPSAPSAAYREK